MLNKNLIVSVIDRSGSMSVIKDDAIGGFNSFIEDQKSDNPDDLVTLVLFNHDVTTVYENRKLAEVEPLNNQTYETVGLTALYEAIGSTMDRVGQQLAAKPEWERPQKVIFVILTDGQENYSNTTEWPTQKVKDMINHQRNKYSWDFVYLAATEEGMQDGLKIGINQRDAFFFNVSSKGIAKAYSTATSVTRSYKVQ